MGAERVAMDRRVANSLCSEDSFRKLETCLWRSKSDRELSIETRKSLLPEFSAVAHWLAREPVNLDLLRWSAEPDDDKFVAAALAAEATWLVSGDRDLRGNRIGKERL